MSVVFVQISFSTSTDASVQFFDNSPVVFRLGMAQAHVDALTRSQRGALKFFY